MDSNHRNLVYEAKLEPSPVHPAIYLFFKNYRLNTKKLRVARERIELSFTDRKSVVLAVRRTSQIVDLSPLYSLILLHEIQ